MEQQRAGGIQRVKSSVEYLCGLLHTLGITCLSPELIRRAKFNHPSAAPPLLHALLHLFAFFPSFSPAARPRSLPICNNLPCQSLQTSLVSTFSSCMSEQNTDSTVHEKKKKTEKKKTHFLQSSHGCSSPSFPSSSDGEQSKPIRERGPPYKHSKVHRTDLHSRKHGKAIPCFAQNQNGSFTRSSKISNGKAPRKDVITRPAPKHGNGNSKTPSQAVAFSNRAKEGMSGERYSTNEQYPALPYAQEDSEAHDGVALDPILSLVTMAACKHEQHLPEETKEKLDYVEFYMAQWGYPHTLSFLAINAQQSRSLLLAMVWMLFRFDIFKRTLRDQLEPLNLSIFKAPLTSNPGDVSQAREALDMGKAAEEDARAHVRKVLTSLDYLKDVKVRIAGRTQQAVMLIGKVSGCIRTLHSLQLSKKRLCQELEGLMLEKRVSLPAKGKLLSHYELHLLQSKEDLRRHLCALQAEKVVTQKMMELQKHEVLFREWIESVIDLSIAEGLHENVTEKQVIEFKEQFSHTEEHSTASACELSFYIANGLGKGANMLCPNSKDIIVANPQQRNIMETLDQNVSIVYTGPILTRRRQNHTESKADSTASSILEMIERLTELAMGVKQVVSSIHSRAMLPEALGAVLYEKCHCLLGLERDVKELVNSHAKEF